MVTATLRNDGSSKFSPENRWGLFPSAAVAWRLSEESFLQNVDFVSNLKLRVGYGVTGQQDIGGNYDYQARINRGEDDARYLFGNTYYTMIRFEAFDSELKWEETSTLNVGLDFGFLSDRINGSVEYYQRTTDDLLNFVPIPIGTNFSNFLTTNIGSMDINGIEFMIDARVVESPDFSWDLGANFTKLDNKISKLTLVDDPNYIGVLTGGISGGVGSTIQVHSIDFRRNTFFALQQVYNETGDPIEDLFIDQNGDGIINDSDRVRFEDPAPDAYFGFSSKFNYKDFDLAINARMNIGNYMYDNVSSTRAVYQNVYNSSNYVNNLVSTISESNFENPHYTSNFYLHDASFFRLDNISLGYYVGNKISDKFEASVRATVQNAFFITNYNGQDPEVAGGIDNNIYPRPRTFLVGLNVKF
jgi:iron complex outermembrane receptor protein